MLTLIGLHIGKSCEICQITPTSLIWKRRTGLFHLKPAESSSQSVLDALYLVSNVKFGNEWTVNDFCADIVNAICGGKLIFQYKEGIARPVGLQTYCFLNDKESKQNLEEGFSPTQETYLRDTGDHLWFYWTVVSPDGCGRKFMWQMRDFLRPKIGKTPVKFFRDTDNCSKTRRGSM